MCGRLNIIDDPFSKLVCEIAGISFAAEPNSDLRPTENVSVISMKNNMLIQQNLNWGVHPNWAKRVIINAQSETVATKPTFRAAFQSNRVIVPCAGWYEWKGDKGRKQKFLFSNPNQFPLFMAGIAIGGHLVTLTTKPNKQCAEYHHRMPLLMTEDYLASWVSGESQDCLLLLTYEYDEPLNVRMVN